MALNFPQVPWAARGQLLGGEQLGGAGCSCGVAARSGSSCSPFNYK